MCKRLWEKYPDILPPDEMQKKYFPDAIKIENRSLHNDLNKCTCHPTRTSQCDIHGYSDLLSKRK